MEKPKFPEIEFGCDFCGYRAEKSKYKHTCWFGIVTSILLFLSALFPIVLLIIKILGVL